MNYGFIKNQVCINIAVFDSQPSQEMKNMFIPSQCDEIVLLQDGFGIGDNYVNGEWIRAHEISREPSLEERLIAIEDALLMLL